MKRSGRCYVKEITSQCARISGADMTAMPPDSAPPTSETSVFARRLQIVTLSVLLLVLVIWLLREFRDILQPLFIALFLGFLTNPLHRWLVRHRIPSLVAYGVIVTLALLGVI